MEGVAGDDLDRERCRYGQREREARADDQRRFEDPLQRIGEAAVVVTSGACQDREAVETSRGGIRASASTIRKEALKTPVSSPVDTYDISSTASRK